jgi:anti-sigma factor RsiW
MPMNCDQAIEFLPWLLNGTLEATERDEVRRHLATCESCRAALNDTRDAWTIFDQHLPSSALVALAYGETPAGVDPAVAERHLASCPECAAELELARTSRRLEEDDKIAVFPRPRDRQEKGSEGSRSWRTAAMAAGLAGLVAMGGWFHELQQVGRLTQAARSAVKPAAQVAQVEPGPRINTWSAQLFPIEEERGKEQAPQDQGTIVPKNESASLALMPRVTDSSDGSREIEILDARNHVRFSMAGLRQMPPDLTYHLSIDKSLTPGAYTIQLYSNENGKRVPRETYKIRVE